MLNPSNRAQRLAASWIFPGLIAAMIIGNQGWMLGPLSAGQILSWGNDAAAAILVLGRFHGRRWPLLLLAVAILLKLATAVGSIAEAADLGFDVVLSILFCAAGAVIVSKKPSIVYRQLLVIAALSIPVMIVQMTGVAPWSEALNTEHTEDVRAPQPTLFVTEAQLHYRTGQARPAGLTHSNNFLSLLAAFLLALHFSRIKTPRLTTRDLIVITFAMLTMSKVVLLVSAVVVMWKLVTGIRVERLRMVRVAGFTVLVLAAYAVFFPGLFTVNTAFYKLSYSFFIRANDFAALLPEGSAVREWLHEQLAGTPRPNKGAVTLSGYAQIITILPYAVVCALLITPVFYNGFLRVRRQYPELVDMTVLTLFVVILFPTAVPMFRAQIFWFVGGFALLPLFTVWEPRRFLRPSDGLFTPPRRVQALR
ncbi:MAG TPA: hypothetical protein VNJ03_04115 [Vicinamibacterales bacterium]|nr:hypothetical protein [Vicinamibacterales bacterium]